MEAMCPEHITGVLLHELVLFLSLAYTLERKKKQVEHDDMKNVNGHQMGKRLLRNHTHFSVVWEREGYSLVKVDISCCNPWCKSPIFSGKFW